MAAPMSWRRLVHSVYSPAIAGVFTRISDRLFRARDRRGGSSVLLLAPLLAEADPAPYRITRPTGSAGAQGSADGLCAHFKWMAEHVPAFRVPGTHIHILRSPDQFYQTMKARIKTAKRRVVMASLYLGTGQLEQEMVDCMEEALQRSQDHSHSPDLKVSILLDYTRGSRGQINSRTMLLPLLQRFTSQMRVSLYHTPDLRGLLRMLVPQRFNETIGVQHIKVYLFDDSIIISGANLSDSYFTNRQDRYVLLENCREVADFFSDLVEAVGDVSLQLQPDDSVNMLEGMVHPYKGNRQDFSTVARERIMEVMNTAHTRQRLLNRWEDSEDEGMSEGEEDTWVFPLVQMRPLGIQVDEQVTQRLLTDAGPDSTVFLTSGYFNLTRAYMRLVLGAGTNYRILTASPEVNGFFGAKGVAGAIPAAYVHIARQFYNQVCQLGQQERVHLHEYHRPQWTFHAKGLWYYLQGQDRPCLTLIGSPNFGYRSVHRDLEAQIAIVTENEELQSQLQEEQESLYQRSSEVSSSTFERPDRHVKLWVKLVTPLIKNFF
ncbi:CDP-diacylglycerol--glycerol-3-phosphate 3-phosphatidyltransferase, mitochondrial [Hippoglossus hippoglossus]|uniref:CDP-diacylglycerol--glycerol-3-phosphate 3-phosphatidyltransferase, mitochondrial n=1 Tax=Hippoglossus hippoglossus TaxID=8267 RepID=UPI00148C5AE9|nr:CDP-diacylglycerol--glycerol-3-phosphate 3-phosphatidyltransferase, mitochondrial [Hippoglossus hippoglossus]XP_035001247.1 CDP-diacylglycerol--glycerol-3-phosphate 3-phosphatidyltransferase, mitochondrial [Hippoglossus stenolepis]